MVQSEYNETLKGGQTRPNRFTEQMSQQKRSLSQDMTKEQKARYQKIVHKNLKRERHSLSHCRYNKMKNLIMKEVKDAIQEAEIEPSASINEINQI